MTDRLSIYNGALLAGKQRRLEELDEELDYVDDLDYVWDNGGIETCLAAGLWNFATRSAEITFTPSITPAFGYRYAIDKPTDFVRLVAISAEGSFHEPYLNYFDEGVYWFTDLESLFVRWISKDDDYGLDFARWPEQFTRYVESYFWYRIAGRVSGADPDDAEAKMERRLKIARGTDAANEASVFPPRGSWVRARGRGRQGRAERGY